MKTKILIVAILSVGIFTAISCTTHFERSDADTVLIQRADPDDQAHTSIIDELTNEQASFAFDPVNRDVGVIKEFDVSVIDHEERSRGRCEQQDMDGDGTPDTSVCCGTEGNSQPEPEGVWCAAVDHASGQVLYKERVAYRGQTVDGRRTYAMRIKMLSERDIAGKATGRLVIQYNMHRGSNNSKGGYDDKIVIVTAKPTRDGLNLGPMQDITQAAINSQIEMTHATMFQSFTGTPTNNTPVFAFVAPNRNSSGGVNASVMNISIDPATGAMKYLGNRPNNPGRNYIDCHMAKNPFVNEITGPAAGVPFFKMCAITGKLTSASVPSMKPDLLFEIWTSVKPEAAPE